MKALLRSYADSIKSYGNNINSFSPYKPFNKVIAFRLNEEYLTTGVTKNISDETYTSNGFKLGNKDISELLEIINAPVYFSFTECGTAITQYEIQFLDGKNVIEKLKIACNDRQLITNSEVKDMNWQRMKYGHIMQKPRERLTNILMNSGVYFKPKY